MNGLWPVRWCRLTGTAGRQHRGKQDNKGPSGASAEVRPGHRRRLLVSSQGRVGDETAAHGHPTRSQEL